MTDEPNDPVFDEPSDLRATLIEFGLDPVEVNRAAADGTMPLLALEWASTVDGSELDIEELAERTGLTQGEIRAMWRALGFPEPRPGERIFTQVDVEAMSAVNLFVSTGAMDPELALQMSRVLGSAMTRVATAVVDALELQRTPGSFEGIDLQGRAALSAEMLSLLPRIMEFVWRRQLGAAARRRRMRATAPEGAGVIVGFADMVGFTATTQQLDEHELAAVVGRFESVAYDVVSGHRGRVVKMIGDEVMFLHDDPREGAELALDIAERFRDDPVLSDLRVGLAAGPVLERDGDVFGHTVNLANRIVTVAYPGSVVVSDEVHDALVDDESFVLRSLRSHYLKDVGRVSLWTLRHQDDPDEQPYRRARQRMAARDFLRDRWIELRRDAEDLRTSLPENLRRSLSERGVDLPVDVSSTGQFEALSDAVLAADIEPETQVELLFDLEAERRLLSIEDEADRRAAAADSEAEDRLDEIDREARTRVAEIEREARTRVEALLEEAEKKSRRVNEEASRKVKQVAEEVERKADRVAKEAKAEAERKTKRRAREREDGHERDERDKRDKRKGKRKK